MDADWWAPDTGAGWGRSRRREAEGRRGVYVVVGGATRQIGSGYLFAATLRKGLVLVGDLRGAFVASISGRASRRATALECTLLELCGRLEVGLLDVDGRGIDLDIMPVKCVFGL